MASRAGPALWQDVLVLLYQLSWGWQDRAPYRSASPVVLQSIVYCWVNFLSLMVPASDFQEAHKPKPISPTIEVTAPCREPRSLRLPRCTSSSHIKVEWPSYRHGLSRREAKRPKLDPKQSQEALLAILLLANGEDIKEPPRVTRIQSSGPHDRPKAASDEAAGYHKRAVIKGNVSDEVHVSHPSSELRSPCLRPSGF